MVSLEGARAPQGPWVPSGAYESPRVPLSVPLGLHKSTQWIPHGVPEVRLPGVAVRLIDGPRGESRKPLMMRWLRCLWLGRVRHAATFDHRTYNIPDDLNTHSGFNYIE